MKAITDPILKGVQKEIYYPLSYRGISLLSKICMIYIGMLNTRIVNYLDCMESSVRNKWI